MRPFIVFFLVLAFSVTCLASGHSGIRPHKPRHPRPHYPKPNTPTWNVPKYKGK